MLDLQHLNIYNYALRAFICTFNLGLKYVMGALICDKNVPLAEFGQNIFLKELFWVIGYLYEKNIYFDFLPNVTVLDLHVSDKSLKLM